MAVDFKDALQSSRWNLFSFCNYKTDPNNKIKLYCISINDISCVRNELNLLIWNITPHNINITFFTLPNFRLEYTNAKKFLFFSASLLWYDNPSYSFCIHSLFVGIWLVWRIIRCSISICVFTMMCFP